MINKDKKIIDIWLGGGYLLNAFKADTKIHNLFGLDITDYQFENVIRNYGFERKNLFTWDATEILTFKCLKSNFDLVLCTDVIEHVFDPIALVDNLVKITKQGGYIVFNIPLELNLKNRLLYLFWEPIHNPFCVWGHIRFFKPNQVLSYFKSRKI